MHLNEEFLHIEPQWIDERRFTPVITDFTRRTQPIVRYKLDDVLVVSDKPCPCGNPARAISHIEGRWDDQLLLPDQQGILQVIFADLCSRVLATALPLTADYRLIQRGDHHLHLMADCTASELECCRRAMVLMLQQQGIETERLCWQLEAVAVVPQFDRKGGVLFVRSRGVKTGLFRAGQLLLGWGFVGVVYNLTDRFQGLGMSSRLLGLMI